MKVDKEDIGRTPRVTKYTKVDRTLYGPSTPTVIDPGDDLVHGSCLVLEFSINH